MSQKSAVRVVVEIGGELKRIISIRERPNGDLNVTVHVSGLLGLQEGGGAKTIKESRYSIHVSPDDPTGNQIKGTTEFSDGTKQFRHLFTNALRDDRLQPIFARSVINPSSLLSLQEPTKGTVVKLPTYDPAQWTMYYALWVCSPQVGLTNPLAGPHPFLRWTFREFTIFAPVCYVPTPSASFSKFWEAGTTTEEHRSARHAELNCWVGPAEGTTPRSAAGTSIWLFNTLIDQPLNVGLAGDAIPPIGIYEPNFFPLPAVE